MNDGTPKSEIHIKDAARDWLLRLSLENPTLQERARFEAWRAEDPRHDTAYRRFEGIWKDAALLTELKELVPSENALVSDAPADLGRSSDVVRNDRFRHRTRLAGGALAAAAAVGALLLTTDLVSSFRATSLGHYATDVAEIREFKLADGSRLTLGARSTIEIDLRGTQRTITLNTGEAFFSVAKDPMRPFVVNVGSKQVRAIGTQFEVHRSTASLRVSVIEGAVEVSEPPVSSSDASRQKHLLTAGQQAITSSVPSLSGKGAEEKDFLRIKEINPAVAATWRTGRLAYVDAPLREVIADAKRYSNQRIELADERVADLQVSVSYRADQVDNMLDGLIRALPVEVTRPTPGRILIKSVDSRGSSVSDPVTRK